MEILRPFDTPVGRVGLAICFDVSFKGIPMKKGKYN
jgi:predicted amidohydrolase